MRKVRFSITADTKILNMKKLAFLLLIFLFSCEKRAETLSVTLEFTDYISHLKVKDIEVCASDPTTSPTCQKSNDLGLVTFKTHPDDYIYSYDKDEQFNASHSQYEFPIIKTDLTSYLDIQQIDAYPKMWFRPQIDTSDIREIVYVFWGIRGKQKSTGYKIKTKEEPTSNSLYPEDFGKAHRFQYNINYNGHAVYLPMDSLVVEYGVSFFNQNSRTFRDTLPPFRSTDTIDFTFKTKL